MCVCVCSLRFPACIAHTCTSMLRPSLQYFSTLSHKRYDIRKKSFEHKILLLTFSTTFFLKHFSFYEKLSEIRSKMCAGLSVKYPYSCYTLMKHEFFRHIFKNYLNFMTFHSVRAQLFHMDRNTDRHE